MAKIYTLYILTNESRRSFYVGVTTNLPQRIYQHKEGAFETAHTKKYRINRLVYYEAHEDWQVAASREKLIKKWRRQFKIELIESVNPEWRDLYEVLV